jgi:iron complex transport system permease protein
MNGRWLLLIVFLFVLFGLNLSLGSVAIPAKDFFRILFSPKDNDVWSDIIWDFRMTKALTCVFAGGALALGGLLMQTLFRNPLAGPDVLGLSSGASLAVSLIYLSNISSFLLPFQSAWTIALASSFGASLVFIIMFGVSRRLQDNVSLLIVGLMVGAGTSSIVSVLQYLSGAEETQTYLLWTFGSLGSLNWTEIKILGVVLLLGIGIALFNLKALNVWVLGDNYTASLGINIKRSRTLSILSASILTGGVTAFCGPIAFVGLAVPHLVKLLIKTNDHRILLPAVIIGGGILLLLCDILARLPFSDNVLPINAITAMIGAPVVIWVILKNKVIRI